MAEILLNAACVAVLFIAWCAANIRDEIRNKVGALEYHLRQLAEENKQMKETLESMEGKLADIENSAHKIRQVADDYRLPARSTIDDI